MPEREGDGRRSGCSFCKGFFLGGFVGAGLALFFAPRVGRETRKLVKEKAAPLKDWTVKKLSEVKEDVEQFFEEHEIEVARMKAEAEKKLASTKDETVGTAVGEEVEKRVYPRKRFKRSRRPREPKLVRNAEETPQTASNK